MAEDVAAAVVKAADHLEKNPRKFASIWACPLFDDHGDPSAFYVTGTSSASSNPDERRNFDCIEDAINFLHGLEFSRINSDEERTMLTTMNDGEDVRGWRRQEPVVVAVFAKMVPIGEIASNVGHVLAVSILEHAQALEKKKAFPQIVSLVMLPRGRMDGHRYEIHGPIPDTILRSYELLDGALNFLTEKGYHQLERTMEESLKKLINRANEDVGQEFAYYKGDALYVLSVP